MSWSLVHGSSDRPNHLHLEEKQVEMVGPVTQIVTSLLPWSSSTYEALLHAAGIGRLGAAVPTRGLAWRIFLGLLPSEGDAHIWLKAAAVARDRYASFCSQLRLKSSFEESGYRNDFDDLLQADLDRLHIDWLEDGFFKVEWRQRLMQRVLTVWALRHPATSYRQGMHELLAVVLLVLERDTESLAASKNSESDSEENRALQNLASAAELEPDAFAVFDRILRHLGPFYEQDGTCAETCSHIQGAYLRAVEPMLEHALQELEVLPQLYGIRWLRLMFLREFADAESVLQVWDFLLACAAAPLFVDLSDTAEAGMQRSVSENENGAAYSADRLLAALEALAVALILSLVDWNLVTEGSRNAVTAAQVLDSLMHGRCQCGAEELILRAQSLLLANGSHQPEQCDPGRLKKRYVAGGVASSVAFAAVGFVVAGPVGAVAVGGAAAAGGAAALHERIRRRLTSAAFEGDELSGSGKCSLRERILG